MFAAGKQITASRDTCGGTLYSQPPDTHVSLRDLISVTDAIRQSADVIGEKPRQITVAEDFFCYRRVLSRAKPAARSACKSSTFSRPICSRNACPSQDQGVAVR